MPPAPHNFTDAICCTPEYVPLPPNIRRPEHLELIGLVRDGIKGMERAVRVFQPRSQAAAKNFPALTARMIRLDAVVTLVKHILRKRMQPDISTKRLQQALVHVTSRAELIIVPDDMLVMPGADLALFRAHQTVCVERLDLAIDSTDPMFDEPDKMRAEQLTKVQSSLDDARAPYREMLRALGYVDEIDVFEQFAHEVRTGVCARLGTV